MLLMLFLVDEDVLKEKEMEHLIKYILAVRDMDESGYEEVLNQLRDFQVR